jgi:hypothetical protein
MILLVKGDASGSPILQNGLMVGPCNKYCRGLVLARSSHRHSAYPRPERTLHIVNWPPQLCGKVTGREKADFLSFLEQQRVLFT